MSPVWLDQRARALIAQEAAARKRVETGGALFGFADGEEVVVACAYAPGPRAKHRPTTFEPHPATTAAVMEAVREESQARYRYLGSWHSHPGGVARPSGRDIATTERVASEPEVLLPQPLVLIQATRRAGSTVVAGELRAWLWDPASAWLLPAGIEDIELELRFCPVVRTRGRRPGAVHVVSPDAS
jgi:integrative and conjugative element protein (TIGR02256 family)